MSNEIVRDVFNAGCLSTLFKMYNVEQEMVSKLDIDDVADFYAFKSDMYSPPLAVFCWCSMADDNPCVSFKMTPSVCLDSKCKLHTRCIVCHDLKHTAVEIYSGAATTRCPVVQRMNDELQMLKNCWRINDAHLWRFFDSIRIK